MRKPGVLLAVLLLAATFTACGSYKKDLDNLCNGLERSGASKDGGSEKFSKMAEWMSENVSSSEGRELFQGLAMVDSETKVRILREEAKKVGITSCPLADAWEAGLKARGIPEP